MCFIPITVYTLHMSDLRSNNTTCSMVKYADDTSLTGCITHEDETGYRNEIVKFVDWCRSNFLVLNSQKRKEIVFDFWRNQKEIELVVINGVEIEIVTEHKYLGTYIDNQLLTGILTLTNFPLRQTSGSIF